MKKRFGKVKKFIAMLMVGVTLSSSVFYSYSIPAQATGLVPAAQTIIEALMTLFGYSLGYGRSSEGFSSVLNADTLSSAVDSALSGTGAVELGSYGSVDFSDAENVMEFIRNAYTLTASWVNAELYSRTHSKYDYVSYKNSGVSSTKTINEMLGDIVTKYETDGTAALQEDLFQAFSSIVVDSSDTGFSSTAWRVAAGLMAAFTAYGALPKLEDGTDDESALVVPYASEYVVYEDFLKNQYFSGYEDTVDIFSQATLITYKATGEYTEQVLTWKFEPLERNNRNIYMLYPEPSSYAQACHIYAYPSETSIKLNRVKDDGSVGSSSTFYVYPLGDWRTLTDAGVLSGHVVVSSVLDLNVPCFRTREDAAAYFAYSDITGMLNGYSEAKAVEYFTETPTCTVPEYVVSFMTKSPSAEDVKDLAAALSALPMDTAGTSQYVPTIEQTIQDATIALPGAEVIPEATAAPVVIPGEATGELTDEELGSLVDSTSTYGGILGVLLNAILALPLKIFDHFVDAFNLILSGIRDGPAIMAELLTEPFSTVTKALDSLIDIFPADFAEITALITTLPVTLYEYFKDGITDVHDGIGTLVDVFPASIADVVDAVIDLPATLWQYLEGTITDIREGVDAIAAEATAPWDDPDNKTEKSFDLVNLLNGLWLLIMILLMLLSIFLHLMIFIINIFKIPATTGYLNDDMILGLNYIKTLEITGIGLSVYDFMMGLVYILMVFGVVKVLRHNINHIKVPKAIKGGLYR